MSCWNPEGSSHIKASAGLKHHQWLFSICSYQVALYIQPYRHQRHRTPFSLTNWRLTSIQLRKRNYSTLTFYFLKFIIILQNRTKQKSRYQKQQFTEFLHWFSPQSVTLELASCVKTSQADSLSNMCTRDCSWNCFIIVTFYKHLSFLRTNLV